MCYFLTKYSLLYKRNYYKQDTWNSLNLLYLWSNTVHGFSVKQCLWDLYVQLQNIIFLLLSKYMPLSYSEKLKDYVNRLTYAFIMCNKRNNCKRNLEWKNSKMEISYIKQHIIVSILKHLTSRPRNAPYTVFACK